MPKAGYCKECKKNVWLKEDGSCQFGHSAENITFAYKTEPKKETKGRSILVVIVALLLLSFIVGIILAYSEDRTTPPPRKPQETKSAPQEEKPVRMPGRPITVDIERSTKDDWNSMTQEQRISLATEFMNKYKGGITQSPEALVSETTKALDKLNFNLVKDTMAVVYTTLEVLQKYEQKKAGIPQIALGMTKEQVQQLVGPPEDSQVSRSQYMTLEYWYYDLEGKRYQISFADGVVNAINQY